MVAIVNIISKCGLWIEELYRNQPNKSNLALYKTLFYCNGHFYNGFGVREHYTYMYRGIQKKI